MTQSSFDTKIKDFLRPIPGDRDGRCIADAIRVLAYGTAKFGQWSPGVCEVAGAGTPRDWDIRKGYGFTGATIIYTGDNVARFDVAIRIWTQTQLDEWREFYRTFLQKPPRNVTTVTSSSPFLPTVQPKALRISHPVLDELGINDVVVEDVTQFVQIKSGVWELVVKLLQYRAPIAMLGKPSGPVPGVSKTGSAVEGAFADKLSFQISSTNADIADLKNIDASIEFGGF